MKSESEVEVRHESTGLYNNRVLSKIGFTKVKEKKVLNVTITNFPSWMIRNARNISSAYALQKTTSKSHFTDGCNEIKVN